MALTLVLGCGHRNPPQGTQHTGGGSVAQSTTTQVQAAIDKAILLLTVEDKANNILVQFWKETQGPSPTSTFAGNPSHLFPSMQRNRVYSVTEYSHAFQSPALDAFRKNTILRLESGSCRSPQPGMHPDASVSAHNLSAEICFNIVSLRRIPPSTLLREVLSLAIHEAVHMGGGDEGEARLWQNSFSTYFGNRFGDVTSDNVTVPTLKSIGEARLLVRRALALAGRNIRDQKIFGEVGKMHRELSNLPYLRDSLAIDLKVSPARPEVIGIYQNSVLALVSKIEMKFDFRNGQVRVGPGFRIPFSLMPEDKIVPTLEEFLGDLDTIQENFLAILGSPSAGLPPQ